MKLNRDAWWDKWLDEWQRLRDVDIQALDIKEAGSWPLLLKALCLLLALSLSVAAMYWFVIGERRDALASETRQETRLLEEYRSKAAEAAHLPKMEEQLNEINAQMTRLRRMLPTSVEIPSLLDSISDAAVNNQLNIENIRLRSTVTQAHYVEHPFDIQVQGEYHQIAQFVADMAALSRIVTQHDFTLEPVESQGSMLRLSMLARTYSDIVRVQGSEDEA
ncbi:type 4a pilus biogenesis protein PilO [Halomonas vilamensis]|uniref:Type 4a pilus biogenesis protein PilO n=1 Tax=Vreelandella vilamensis TaxID=531309 RepID=A0ABU1H4G3_9GAMM|nr:type 4a pilus biogenesis protein PilO [Halomonas vilamensis]MDR5899197.1 type 4a pilus biogenesis protein PilO [Halomonas vilamensis]